MIGGAVVTTKLGPKYRTCDSCRTRVSIAVVSMSSPEGGRVCSFYLCDRCMPSQDIDGMWTEMHEAPCRMCLLIHNGPECE